METKRCDAIRYMGRGRTRYELRCSLPDHEGPDHHDRSLDKHWREGDQRMRARKAFDKRLEKARARLLFEKAVKIAREGK